MAKDDGKFSGGKGPNIIIKAGPREELKKHFKHSLAIGFNESINYTKSQGRWNVLQVMTPQEIWDEIKKMIISNAHSLIVNLSPNQFHGAATTDPSDNPNGFNYPEVMDDALTDFLIEVKARMEDGASLTSSMQPFVDKHGAPLSGSAHEAMGDVYRNLTETQGNQDDIVGQK